MPVEEIHHLARGAQRFVAAAYDHELCRELRGLGYRIRPNGRSFEIDGISAELTRNFSKRSRQIAEETAKRLNREGFHGNLAEIRDQVAHNKRRRKIKEATADRLRSSWLAQLDRDLLGRRLQAGDKPEAMVRNHIARSSPRFGLHPG